MSSERQDDYIILWEAPKIVPPEFRLYYDDKGYVLNYTCEKLEGNYIIIDAITFAEARPDVRVVDGKVLRSNSSSVVSKLKPSKKGTVTCAKEDISIIVTGKQRIKTQEWNLETYEL